MTVTIWAYDIKYENIVRKKKICREIDRCTGLLNQDGNWVPKGKKKQGGSQMWSGSDMVLVPSQTSM